MDRNVSLLGFLFFSTGLMLSSAYNIVHNYSFVLKETPFTRLCTTKNMLTVNGMFPGPTINVRRGDRAFVNVQNKGNYGVTIHWHGVKQPRNPWSDGPENVTQCPIKPGTNFTYEVIFSTEEGTLWWHAHSDWSRATVHGAIVILSPIFMTYPFTKPDEENTLVLVHGDIVILPPIFMTYPFTKPDEENTLVLGSWFDTNVKEIVDNITETGANPVPSDAYTINGWPGVLYDCSNETTAYHMNVTYGKTYLLRVVNAVMNEEIFFGIANHTLEVVAQDAAYIKPIITNYIMITPGQTMDILLRANQSASQYYIAAKPYYDPVIVASFDNSTGTAILQYTGSSVPSAIPLPALPTVTNSTAADNFTKQIKSLKPVNVPQKIRKSIFMTASVNQKVCGNTTCSSASMNNISFVTPTLDILQAYYRKINNGTFTNDFPNQPENSYNYTGINSTDPTVLYPKMGTKVITVNYNDTVEIIWQGTNVGNAENHPMHLHGFSFYLVGTGYGNFNNQTSPKTYNLVNPPEVNTIGVPKNGWATIRFIADNPGVWFMHCHLERHATWGMDAVLIVNNGLTPPTSMLRPPPNLPTCY